MQSFPFLFPGDTLSQRGDILRSSGRRGEATDLEYKLSLISLPLGTRPNWAQGLGDRKERRSGPGTPSPWCDCDSGTGVLAVATGKCRRRTSDTAASRNGAFPPTFPGVSLVLSRERPPKVSPCSSWLLSCPLAHPPGGRGVSQQRPGISSVGPVQTIVGPRGGRRKSRAGGVPGRCDHGGPLWPLRGVLRGTSASFPDSSFLDGAEERGHGPGGQRAWARRPPGPWRGLKRFLVWTAGPQRALAGCHLPALGGSAPTAACPCSEPSALRSRHYHTSEHKCVVPA